MNRRVPLAVGLIAAVAFGCASSPREPSSAPASANVDIAGSWNGRVVLDDGLSYDIFYTLEQAGAKVTGKARISGLPASDLEGKVIGDKFTYGLVRGRCCAEFLVNGDEMTGKGIAGNRIQVRRVR